MFISMLFLCFGGFAAFCLYLFCLYFVITSGDNELPDFDDVIA